MNSNKVNAKQSKNVMAKQNADRKKMKFNKKGKQTNGKNQFQQNSNNKGGGKKNLNQKQNRGVKRQMEDGNKSTKKYIKTDMNKVKVNSSVEDASETGILIKAYASMKTSFANANSYLESLKSLQKQHNLNTSTYIMDNVDLKVLLFHVLKPPLNKNEIDKIKKDTNACEICSISLENEKLLGTLLLKFSNGEDANKIEQTGFITIRGRKSMVRYLLIKGNVNSSVEDGAETDFLIRAYLSLKTSSAEAKSYLDSIEELQKQHNLATCNYVMSKAYLKVLLFHVPNYALSQHEVDELKNSTNACEICNIRQENRNLLGNLLLKFSNGEDAKEIVQTGIITVRGKPTTVKYLIVRGNTENTKSEKTVAAKPKKGQQKVKAMEVDEEDEEDDDVEEKENDYSDEKLFNN